MNSRDFIKLSDWARPFGWELEKATCDLDGNVRFDWNPYASPQLVGVHPGTVQCRVELTFVSVAVTPDLEFLMSAYMNGVSINDNLHIDKLHRDKTDTHIRQEVGGRKKVGYEHRVVLECTEFYREPK